MTRFGNQNWGCEETIEAAQRVRRISILYRYRCIIHAMVGAVIVVSIVERATKICEGKIRGINVCDASF